jgi:hypothetical protein
VLVPPAAERMGDFSASVDNNRNPVPAILDPLSRAPFPNKQVPLTRFYAPGQALLDIFPMPNTTQTANFNYTSQLPGASPRRETLVRVDYNITNNLRVLGHWIDDQQPTVTPYGSFVLGLNVPIANIANPIPGRSFAAGATWVISPTMTNELNWGFTHNSILIDETGNQLTRTASGINLPVLYPGAVQKDYIPNVTFNGTRITASPGFGSSDAPFVNFNTTIDLSDNLTKVWGKHTIKTGWYMQRSRKDQTSFSNNNGSYNFGDNPGNPFDTGFGFSNALLAVDNSFNQSNSYINGQYRYWNLEGFVQDTWKITPRLTLDYGLRGAWYQPQFDASGQSSTFLNGLWSAANAPRLYLPANAFVRPDQFNREANYSPASFDRRQALAINYVYTTPTFFKGNKLTRLVTDGWQVSGVTQALTRAPFTPGFNISGAGNQNITGSNSEPARIGVVKGCDPYTHSNDPFLQLNAACFFAPSPGSIGLESGINFLYGPSVVNFDMAVQKQFAVKERVKLQLRVDAFNVFNHTEFSGYNGTLNFNSYPTTNGIVNSLPTITATALGHNPNGSYNLGGFGAPTQVGPGALGYARILQTVIRIQF